MRKRVLLSALAVVLVVAIAMVALVGCAGDKMFKTVSSYTFWGNKGEQSIAVTKYASIIDDHMKNDNGKEKKVLAVGFDGCRADALINVLPSGIEENGQDTLTVNNGASKFSGINTLIEMGGKPYLAYTGGEKGKSSEQETSTAPGWAAILTGEWGEKNGVVNNPNEKNPRTLSADYKTLLLKYAENNKLNTSFNASWADHFTRTYIGEMDYLKRNTDIPMQYNQVKNDAELHEKMLGHINNVDSDIVFGIYEMTDYAGHARDFGNTNNAYVSAFRNLDNNVLELINAVKSRETYNQEDWLIMILSDHGGQDRGHGMQSVEARTVFFVTNKTVDAKYFGKGYDGFKEN